jgi:tetratricopeptide (TPR) repeat protein
VTDVFAQLQDALQDRYRLEHELGQGGMATVYLARDLKHDRDVALKVLRPELAATLGAERFLREIATSAQLTHPHILPLYDSGEAAGVLYFVMPRVEGESLRDRLAREHQLPIPDVRVFAREIADALGYAHAHGIVHRDIKPENVLLSGGHAVVADFGVAKAVDVATGGTPVTSTGIAVGTAPYMAPEQAAADPAMDHRADLYALGMVTYEMLTGGTPFDDGAERQRPGPRLAPGRRPLGKLRPDCPRPLAAIVMRCLEQSPAARPQHAGEVLRWLDGAPVPGARSPRRRLVAAAAVAVAALAIAAVAGTGLIPAGRRATLLTLLRRPDAELKANRVLVTPFDDETADTTLRDLGALAADWIGQGIAQVPGTEVVDPRTTLGTQEVVRRIPWPLRAHDVGIATAQEVDAGTLVSGRVYREGDSLLFIASITDVRRGRLVRTLAPVRTSRATPSRALSELQRRVAGSLALSLDATGGTSITTLAEPPSLEAYQEVSRGFEAYLLRDNTAACAHFERALRLDSAYTTALVFLAVARTYHFQYAVADTVVRRAERLSDRMTPAERALLDHLKAVIRGDREQALRAAERFSSLIPGSDLSPLLLASVALSVQQPGLARSALARINPDRGLHLVAPMYWTYEATAAAELGDWSRSLTVAREGQRRFPESAALSALAVRALARLGRVREMEQVIAQLPAGRDPLTAQAELAVKAWAELCASGHRDAAATLMTRYARLLDAARADTTRAARFVRGGVLWRAGRPVEARDVFAALARADTGVVRLRDLGQLGIASARLGDREGAARAEREIAAANLAWGHGAPELFQASIAAALGERDRAVQLLRQGLALGLGLETVGGALMGNPDLEPLFGYALFEALLRPAG